MSLLDLSGLRRTYAREGLRESDAADDPFTQFAVWFADASAAKVAEPNAMTLATSSPDGQPSARIVLLKGVSTRGFAFYTDYRSDKAAQLDANPRAALVFWWEPLERQVRVVGTVERASREESAAYYRSRPRGSRLGAWASHQSTPLPDRETLERELTSVEAQFRGVEDVPLPDHWGGYRVAPTEVEFWQGRPNRLHDRLRYRRDAGDAARWVRERLAP
jgi:pyridoxamine 5'-phosphate oxidase